MIWPLIYHAKQIFQCSIHERNRVGGRDCSRRPLTPPYVRFRIRRFLLLNVVPLLGLTPPPYNRPALTQGFRPLLPAAAFLRSFWSCWQSFNSTSSTRFSPSLSYDNYYDLC